MVQFALQRADISKQEKGSGILHKLAFSLDVVAVSLSDASFCVEA